LCIFCKVAEDPPNVEVWGSRVWVPVDLVVGVMGLRAATENVSALAILKQDEEDMCRTKKPW
jgi:hypothetical protein